MAGDDGRRRSLAALAPDVPFTTNPVAPPDVRGARNSAGGGGGAVGEGAGGAAAPQAQGFVRACAIEAKGLLAPPGCGSAPPSACALVELLGPDRKPVASAWTRTCKPSTVPRLGPAVPYLPPTYGRAGVAAVRVSVKHRAGNALLEVGRVTVAVPPALELGGAIDAWYELENFISYGGVPASPFDGPPGAVRILISWGATAAPAPIAIVGAGTVANRGDVPEPPPFNGDEPPMRRSHVGEVLVVVRYDDGMQLCVNGEDIGPSVATVLARRIPDEVPLYRVVHGTAGTPLKAVGMPADVVARLLLNEGRLPCMADGEQPLALGPIHTPGDAKRLVLTYHRLVEEIQDVRMDLVHEKNDLLSRIATQRDTLRNWQRRMAVLRQCVSVLEGEGIDETELPGVFKLAGSVEGRYGEVELRVEKEVGRLDSVLHAICAAEDFMGAHTAEGAAARLEMKELHTEQGPPVRFHPAWKTELPVTPFTIGTLEFKLPFVASAARHVSAMLRRGFDRLILGRREPGLGAEAANTEDQEWTPQSTITVVAAVVYVQFAAVAFASGEVGLGAHLLASAATAFSQAFGRVNYVSDSARSAATARTLQMARLATRPLLAGTLGGMFERTGGLGGLVGTCAMTALTTHSVLMNFMGGQEDHVANFGGILRFQPRDREPWMDSSPRFAAVGSLVLGMHLKGRASGAWPFAIGSMVKLLTEVSVEEERSPLPETLGDMVMLTGLVLGARGCKRAPDTQPLVPRPPMLPVRPRVRSVRPAPPVDPYGGDRATRFYFETYMPALQKLRADMNLPPAVPHVKPPPGAGLF